jgi:large subunit ribosomal protein L15
MKYNELQVTANKDRKRVGRGISAGQGKTAGRGTKGQNSRTGHKLRATFMGGQGPLVQRIPKNRGFKSLRAKAQTVYTGGLNGVKGATIDAMTLYEAGLVASPYHSIKLILRGEYTGKATIRVTAASAGAIKQIEKAGGKFESTDVPMVPSSNPERAEAKAEKKALKTEKVTK